MMKSCRRKPGWDFFEEELLLRVVPTTPLQIFCKIILSFKWIIQISIIDETLSMNGLRTNTFARSANLDNIRSSPTFSLLRLVQVDFGLTDVFAQKVCQVQIS